MQFFERKPIPDDVAVTSKLVAALKANKNDVQRGKRVAFKLLWKLLVSGYTLDAIDRMVNDNVILELEVPKYE